MHVVESKTGAVANNTEIKKSVIWIYYVLFFAVLNESVFNVSTPKIAEQFNLSAAGVSWVVTIFFILFGMGMVIFGKLSDMFSIKKLIVLGIVLYCLGSILGFALQSWYPGIVLARAIQGIGGSAIPALVFVLVARFFSMEEAGENVRHHHFDRLVRDRDRTGAWRVCRRLAALVLFVSRAAARCRGDSIFPQIFAEGRA